METFDELSSENSEDAQESLDFFRNYFDSYDILEDDDDSVFGDDDEDSPRMWSIDSGTEGNAVVSGTNSGPSLQLVPVGDDSKSGARKKKRHYKRKIVKRPMTTRPNVPRNRTDIRIEYARMLANVMNQYTVHCLSGFLSKFSGENFELRMECLHDQAPPGLKELPEPCNVSFKTISTAAAFWGLYVYQIPDNTFTIHSTNIMENYRDAEGKKGFKVECEFTKTFTRVMYASPNDMVHVISAVEMAQSLRRGLPPPGMGQAGDPSSMMPPMNFPFPAGPPGFPPPGMGQADGPSSMMPPMNFPFPAGPPGFPPPGMGQADGPSSMMPPMNFPFPAGPPGFPPPGMGQADGPSSMMPPMNFPFPAGPPGFPPPGMGQADGPSSMMPPMNFPFPGSFEKGGLPPLPFGLPASQSMLMLPPGSNQAGDVADLHPSPVSSSPPSPDGSQPTVIGNAIADEVISMIRSNLLPPPPRLPRPVRHVLKGKVFFYLNSKKAIEKLEFYGVPTASTVL
eukprot:gene761-540_t